MIPSARRWLRRSQRVKAASRQAKQLRLIYAAGCGVIKKYERFSTPSPRLGLEVPLMTVVESASFGESGAGTGKSGGISVNLVDALYRAPLCLARILNPTRANANIAIP